MASLNKILNISSWGKKAEEDEYIKLNHNSQVNPLNCNPIENLDESGCSPVKTEDKPKVKSIYEELLDAKMRNFSWGIIDDVRETYNGVFLDIIINPVYLFKQPLIDNVGVLSIGEYRSKISNIKASFFLGRIENQKKSFSYKSPHGYFYSDDYNDLKDTEHFYHNKFSGTGLSVTRQVYLNSSYPFVSQENELILSEQHINTDIPFRCNISITTIQDFNFEINRTVDYIKDIILKDFLKEINKSKLEISQKKFNSDISIDLVTDTFQHVIDLSCESKVTGSDDGKPYIYLNIPIDISCDKYRMNMDLDKKSIDIFYELMEGVSQIKGEFDVCTNIAFTSDGICLTISAKPIDLVVIKSKEEIGEEYRNNREYNPFNNNTILFNPYSGPQGIQGPIARINSYDE